MKLEFKCLACQAS